MMGKIPKTVKIIVTLGLIPFFVGAVTTFKLPIIDLDIEVFLINFSLLYASLILSFLGGCLFGFEALNGPAPNKLRLWLAIIPSMWSLIATQIPNFSASFLAVGFLIVYEFDRKFHSAGIVPSWWLSLRLPLTVLVIASLSIIGFHHAG